MEDQISSTTPSADDLSKREQEYMDESLDLMENNEAEPRPADPVNQSVTPVSFSNPEPFAIPEKTPTASTGKPTETEQHQGEKKQTKTQEIPEKSEKTTPVEEEKREAPKPESPAVSSSSSSGFSMVDLLYWRDIKKTGVVFGASLFLLLSLTVCSIVSVFSYLALALLSVSITFRIYKGILQAVQKSDEGHPFKAYLDSDVAVSEEVVHKYSDAALGHINCALKELRHLFLVEDLVDSLKFAVLMWILTYVGALFNGLTLLILALISLFSIPVIYERHQAQIDHYLALVNNQVKDIVAKIQAKVPGLKRKSE
ncbi:reticulon-1-A-like isoform X6 [Polyodon spathula]|uniref:reticulon-1-A-like isoform X6 n=1 Tax=Polyodon spathula TaxID=7913 RepID=UPI001B7E9A58|nr:reticulon-1-A-like isoform X6 [Polyodon spathula]